MSEVCGRCWKGRDSSNRTKKTGLHRGTKLLKIIVYGVHTQVKCLAGFHSRLLFFFFFFFCCCYSVAKSCLDSLWPSGLQHTRLPCPSLSPRVCSDSRPLSRWCHPAISSSHLLLLLTAYTLHVQDIIEKKKLSERLESKNLFHVINQKAFHLKDFHYPLVHSVGSKKYPSRLEKRKKSLDRKSVV